MKVSSKKQIRVLVTAGPTRAYLDDVRYLTNFSTGELAYETVRRFTRSKKLDVSLVVGPSCFDFRSLKLKRLSHIQTTEQMQQQVLRECQLFKPQVAIFSAAVLDFTPTRVLKEKRRSVGNWKIELKPTPKIIDEVGKRFPHIRRIGFKLETTRLSPAQAKRLAIETLKAKNLDALCFNFLPDIRLNGHKALLVSRCGKVGVGMTKKEIAQWLYEQTLELNSLI